MVRIPDGKLIAVLRWDDKRSNSLEVEAEDPSIRQLIMDTMSQPALAKVPRGDGYAYEPHQNDTDAYGANLRRIKIPGMRWTTPNALEYLLTHQDGPAFQDMMHNYPELWELMPPKEDIPRLIEWLRSL